MVLHGVDDNEHVSKLSGDDASAVVSGMFRPHDVDLVVTQVPQLWRAGWARGKERQGLITISSAPYVNKVR